MSPEEASIDGNERSRVSDSDVLPAILEATANLTGESFFRALVQHLARALDVRHAFVSEFLPPDRVRTRAYWSGGGLVENVEYALERTPCKEVINGVLVHYIQGMQQAYPESDPPGIEGYLGVPLFGNDSQVVGHLCAFDERSIRNDPRRVFTFQIFAARASAEFDRIHAEATLRESEQRLQDLFDEAPIAYVHEDLDSRFISANRAAMRILGLRPDEVRGMLGSSLVPDTPDAQDRLKQAFDSIRVGTDTSGAVLELRRKDDGRQIFIQWWSKPDPGGEFTRTMFVDITDRIRLEQEQARLRAQNLYLQEEIKTVHNFEEIVGATGGMARVLQKVSRVAPTDATVLIWGETGTGKELIARAIHSGSQRADKPFIKLNIAALPAGLVESELFGHEKGAFSGAIQRRIGRFELANGGTIFLDEIGEAPIDVQVKLLRVLQEQEFERVGGSQTIRSSVRVIAATNRDLPQAIRGGGFRADLFYRLNVFPIDLPALRERPEDIPLLVRYFVEKYARRIGRRFESVDPGTMHRLVAYDWPGNVRELENVIERALILSTGPVLDLGSELLEPRSSQGMRPASASRGSAGDDAVAGGDNAEDADLNTVQRIRILGALRKSHGVIEGERGAACQLGMKPATLRHRMKKLGIPRSGES